MSVGASECRSCTRGWQVSPNGIPNLAARQCGRRVAHRLLGPLAWPLLALYFTLSLQQRPCQRASSRTLAPGRHEFCFVGSRLSANKLF